MCMPGFLKLFLCRYLYVRVFGLRLHLYVCVCMCVFVCPHLRLLITSGVMWNDMDHILLVKQVYSCYMATIVIIVNGRVLGIGTHCRH